MKVTKLVTNEERKCKAADVFHEFPASVNQTTGSKPLLSSKVL
jgi:hypothetical protein